MTRQLIASLRRLTLVAVPFTLFAQGGVAPAKPSTAKPTGGDATPVVQQPSAPSTQAKPADTKPADASEAPKP